MGQFALKWNSLALVPHAADGGVLALAVDAEQSAAPPPLLHDVLGQEPVDALVV